MINTPDSNKIISSKPRETLAILAIFRNEATINCGNNGFSTHFENFQLY